MFLSISCEVPKDSIKLALSPISLIIRTQEKDATLISAARTFISFTSYIIHFPRTPLLNAQMPDIHPLKRLPCTPNQSTKSSQIHPISQLLNSLPSTNPPSKPRHLRPPSAPSNRPLLLITPRIAISALPPLLPPRLHIPPTRTATCQTKVNQPRKNAKRRRNPHKHKHLRSQPRTDIQALLARNHVLKDNEHDGSDDRSGGSEQRGYERPDREWEGPPA